MARYEVTGPLAVVKDRAGKVRYYYAGASIPGDIAPDQLERLAELGLIGKVVDPTPTDADLRAALDAGGTDVPRPAQVAPKAVWVDYAVSRGLARDKAEAMSKGELVDAYPPE